MNGNSALSQASVCALKQASVCALKQASVCALAESSSASSRPTVELKLENLLVGVSATR